MPHNPRNRETESFAQHNIRIWLPHMAYTFGLGNASVNKIRHLRGHTLQVVQIPGYGSAGGGSCTACDGSVSHINQEEVGWRHGRPHLHRQRVAIAHCMRLISLTWTLSLRAWHSMPHPRRAHVRSSAMAVTDMGGTWK